MTKSEFLSAFGLGSLLFPSWCQRHANVLKTGVCSRLETIFEVPLKRRNGSESCFGQRRMKRFLEFLEVGEVRKPRKLLAAAPAAASSRTRRGSGSFQRDEAASHCTQDLDSVLCAKLDQLRLWLVHDGNDSEQMVCWSDGKWPAAARPTALLAIGSNLSVHRLLSS